MLSNPIFRRVVALCFMVLVSFSIAKSIQTASALAFGLAVLSLGAGINFLYLLKKAREQEEPY